MVKTKKRGVLYKGVIQKSGVVLTLPAQDEARLVRQGWCSYVESPSTGQQETNQGHPEGPQTAAPSDKHPEDAQEQSLESTTAGQPEDGPLTDLPEESKRPRSRKK